ncbi:MAG TPA: lipopolysaccharide biosynthesis protein [Methylophilus sp.]
MLKQRVVSASLWSLLDVLGRQGLTFVTTYVLARLLTPEDFGAVALLAVIAGLAGIFVDGGFSFALIQRQDATHDDESSVFWINILIACVLFGLLLSTAPLIARFLGMPTLELLMLPFAATIVVGAASSVHVALLTKKLAFRTLGIVNALAAGFAGLLAIAMAALGYGIWALAAQAIATSVVTTVALWGLHAWRPHAVIKWDSIRRLFAFGSFMFLSTLLDKVTYGLQSTLIGKLYGPRDLGLYSRAESMLNFPLSMVAGLVNRVAFPLFASIADDRDRMLRGVRKAVRIAMFVNAPMMLGLAATSDLTIHVLLGNQWNGAAPILAVMCLTGLIWPLHIITLSVLSGLGRSDLCFRIEVFKKAITIPLLLVASQFGVMWFAWTQVLMVGSAVGVTLAVSYKLLGYSCRDVVSDCRGPVLAAGCMAAGVWCLGVSVDAGPLLKWLVLVSFGGALYAAIASVCRVRAFAESLELLRLHRSTGV